MHAPSPSAARALPVSVVLALLLAPFAVWAAVGVPPPAPPDGLDGLGVALVEDARELDALPALLAGPAPACGEDVAISALLVAPGPDDGGEQLVLETYGVAPVELDGWRLVAGRRARSLAGLVATPGEPLRLGGVDAAALAPVRLPNEAGVVRLVDPCGVVVAAVGWGGLCEPPGRGVWLRVGPRERDGPERSETVGAGDSSGCGQT
ncbi:MAG: hypothetical protein KC635_09695 [Myxococcales bacterium]|nr:hypothetical protein [Myxococcales bacterium]MCB9736401.1 hypothetical protein [Deltaproteobacteria bacterium]